MDCLRILSLGATIAIGLAPLAYCEAVVQRERQETDRVIVAACIEAGGTWSRLKGSCLNIPPQTEE